MEMHSLRRSRYGPQDCSHCSMKGAGSCTASDAVCHGVHVAQCELLFIKIVVKVSGGSVWSICIDSREVTVDRLLQPRCRQWQELEQCYHTTDS
jgi:hypothetical protein